jgi:hypothetical protein
MRFEEMKEGLRVASYAVRPSTKGGDSELTQGANLRQAVGRACDRGCAKGSCRKVLHRDAGSSNVPRRWWLVLTHRQWTVGEILKHPIVPAPPWSKTPWFLRQGPCCLRIGGSQSRHHLRGLGTARILGPQGRFFRILALLPSSPTRGAANR